MCIKIFKGFEQKFQENPTEFFQKKNFEFSIKFWKNSKKIQVDQKKLRKIFVDKYRSFFFFEKKI